MDDISIYIENLLRKIIREEINLAFRQREHIESTFKTQEEFITVDEACKLLRMSKPTLYKSMREGLIKSNKIGNRVLFHRDELINTIKNRVTQNKI